MFDRSGLPLVLERVELSGWGLVVRIAAEPDDDARALLDAYLMGLEDLSVLELLSARHPAGKVFGAMHVEVADDAGTLYRTVARPGAGGASAPWSWEWRFTPPPPSGSAALTVHAWDDEGNDVEVRVALGPR